ncbi:MAG: T9SS type A sorting domain-containing protein, partial [Bacteroidota bacterium]|nr:T9SS type A sorting domain-containing protein [Bacteroidota bacterium]
DVTLVVTNAAGTDSVTKNSYVSVSPQVQPVIFLNNNDSICTGQNVFLSSTNGSTYKWHPFNQISQGIPVVNAGTYSVTVTDAFNCASTSAPVDIYVFPAPPVPIVTVVADTLYSSASTGNQWFLNGIAITGATDSMLVTTGWGGNYTVQVADSLNLCKTTSSIFVGLNDGNDIGVNYSIYPNPGDGYIHLVIGPSSKELIQIDIQDAIGKSVLTIPFQPSLNGEIKEIDISSYGSGVYFLSISTSKGRRTEKVIVY